MSNANNDNTLEEVSIRETGEFALISQLLHSLPLSAEAGRQLDDCSIIPTNKLGKIFLTSVDTLVEGRHFARGISGPEDIGYRALATAISDIAAMGGEPQFALINLQFPRGEDPNYLERCYEGVGDFCVEFSVKIIGGNLSAASELSLAVTVIGSSNSKPLLRSGASPGDDVWVSSTPLGLADLGLRILKGSPALAEEIKAKAIQRYQRPKPRIEVGKKLAELGVSSCIDISDGLIQDASHIAIQSNVDIDLDLSKVLIRELSEANAVECLIGGGDYELLFSAPASLRSELEKLGFTRCGTVSSGTGKVYVSEKYKALVSGGRLGYQHTTSD